MLSKMRDMAAAKGVFGCALKTVGQAPETVTTDGHDSYPRAVRETLGPDVCHRTSRYMNNRIEQDHRGIKQRYYPMRGFGSFDAATRFCTAHDELRDYLRPRTRFNEAVSLAARAGQLGVVLDAAPLEPRGQADAARAIVVAFPNWLVDRRAQQRRAVVAAPIGQEAPRQTVASAGDVNAIRGCKPKAQQRRQPEKAS